MNYLRKGVIIYLLIILLLGSVAHADMIQIAINGQNVEFNSDIGIPFIDDNGRTQVPFRATLEKFGAVVSWDSATNMAVATKNNIIVGVPIGEKVIYKNGSSITVDSCALIKDGRTFLPIRAVIEAFESEVSWDDKTHRVIITDKAHNVISPNSFRENINTSDLYVNMLDQSKLSYSEYLDSINKLDLSALDSLNCYWPVNGRQSKAFGIVMSPITHKYVFTSNLSIAADTGFNVKPILEGHVISEGWDGGWGNRILVDHGNNIVSMYAHLNEISVNIGDSVDTNSVIGLVGSTGATTGPNLGLVVYYYGYPINPREYLNFNSNN